MNLVIFFLGLLIAIFSYPKIMSKVMSRLFNEGLVTPRIVKPEKAEVIKFAGPNLSLFVIGIILMLIAIILRRS